MEKPLFTGPEAIAWDTSQNDPYGSEEGRRVGVEILDMIGEALRRPDEERRVRALAECVRRFPRETLRHPEVHAYLEHLSRRRDTAAITRIFDDRPHRGRPPRSAEDEFSEVAIVEGIIEREGCSVRRAAETARREHPSIFGYKSERSIANDYSQIGEAYRLARQHRWVPGDKLTDAPWRSPEAQRRGR